MEISVKETFAPISGRTGESN